MASLEGYTPFEFQQRTIRDLHHLKTLVESFIYLHWVGQETSETRAKLLFAKAAERKVIFFKENRGYVEDETYEIWEQAVRNQTIGLEHEWKKFRKLSLDMLASKVSQELGGWYDRVYRLASEPAHVSDLWEYMPLPNEPIRLGETKTSLLWANIAVDYGLQLMFDLLKNVSDFYELGLDEKLGKLRATHATLRNLPV